MIKTEEKKYNVSVQYMLIFQNFKYFIIVIFVILGGKNSP
jgi:hypothetical protein